jgi:hypothetical protein
MTYDFPAHISGDTWSGINSITIASNGIPVNLENSEVIIQVRSSKNPSSPLVYEFSTLTSTILIVSESYGIINIPQQIIDIPVGMYQYDLKIISQNGTIKTYLKGEWEILPNISR